MVKVKLRVPLSSAPRETSSPLANPLRSAPDYSDDDDDGTPLPDGATPEAGSEGSDAEELDEDEDEDQEADELDELDELEAEDDESLSKNASSSTPNKRRSITLKPRSSKGGASSSASPSVDGSASPLTGARLVKRGNTSRMAQVQAMTVEELDALPAAKRRKTAKARGAAGPGRGWRKGLTKGQKPVYELPPAETTPTTFGNTASARSTPAAAPIKLEGTPTPATVLPKPKPAAPHTASGESSKSAAPSAPTKASGSAAGGSASGAAASIKIVSGPGGHTFTGDLSAKAGTAKNPGFRYPPLPSSRSGPPVQPLAKIPTSFQAVIPLERNGRQPRRWLKAKREVLSMGGRPWSIPVFYGGEDRGYEKKVDVTATAGAGAVAGAGAGAGAEKGVSKAGTPSAAAAPAASTPAAAATTTTTAAAPVAATAGMKAVSPTPTPTPTATAQSSSTPKAAAAAGGSPLPPPKHLNGLANQAETNWRGQSPAFLFGGR